jgi:hypothetical protein
MSQVLVPILASRRTSYPVHALPSLVEQALQDLLTGQHLRSDIIPDLQRDCHRRVLRPTEPALFAQDEERKTPRASGRLNEHGPNAGTPLRAVCT